MTMCNVQLAMCNVQCAMCNGGWGGEVQGSCRETEGFVMGAMCNVQCAISNGWRAKSDKKATFLEWVA